MILTPEEIRILISWFTAYNAMTLPIKEIVNSHELLEKLRAELKKIENKEMK